MAVAAPGAGAGAGEEHRGVRIPPPWPVRKEERGEAVGVPCPRRIQPSWASPQADLASSSVSGSMASPPKPTTAASKPQRYARCPPCSCDATSEVDPDALDQAALRKEGLGDGLWEEEEGVVTGGRGSRIAGRRRHPAAMDASKKRWQRGSGNHKVRGRTSEARGEESKKELDTAEEEERGRAGGGVERSGEGERRRWCGVEKRGRERVR